ncbi:hypothetical protein BC831DRAFT_469243 [Entophlyctis helioformis]|nr:hypothetical protein BC831DRAFT_469243 [Entophlyctis helioformis]
MSKAASDAPAPTASGSRSEQQQQQSFVWFAPSSLHLDLVDDATTTVALVRAPASDTAKPCVRLTYSASVKSATASFTATPTDSFADGTASFSLRTALTSAPSSSSSFFGSLFGIGQSTPSVNVTVTVEIPDACQSGLNLVLSGSQRTKFDIKDDFLHPFGDVDVAFTSTPKTASIKVSLSGTSTEYRSTKYNFTAGSLSTRSFKVTGTSEDVCLGDLSAAESVAFMGTSGDIKCGNITAGGDRGVVIQRSSGDAQINGVHATLVSFRSSSGDLTLLGPVGGAAVVKIECASGDVESRDIILAGSLSVHTSSGNIKLDTVSCDSVTFNTTSGSITTKKVEAHDKFNMHTSSGTIRAGDLVAGDDIDVKTSSGDIRLNDVTSRGNVTLLSTSGDVETATVWARSFTSSSSSGDCRLSGINAVDRVDIERSSGNVTAQISFVGVEETAGERAASIRTTSGDIRGVSVSHYRSLKSRSSSGNAELRLAPLVGSTTTVTTTSGNIAAKVASGYNGMVKADSLSGSCSVLRAGIAVSSGPTIESAIGEYNENTSTTMMDLSASSGKVTVDFA